MLFLLFYLFCCWNREIGSGAVEGLEEIKIPHHNNCSSLGMPVELFVIVSC